MPLPPLTMLIALLPAWLGLAAGPAMGPPPMVQRMIVRDEITLHVPITPRPPLRFEWAERRGPKCLSAAMIVGAAMVTPATIDFVMRDRSRVRARLVSDCEGLDFYGGFYVQPDQGAVCAGREEIRSRAGASCRIDHFRRLEAKVKR
jgi:hypothetical protein